MKTRYNVIPIGPGSFIPMSDRAYVVGKHGELRRLTKEQEAIARSMIAQAKDKEPEPSRIRVVGAIQGLHGR